MNSPSPFHIGRFHSTQVNVLFISKDNERVYSGDTSGRVACTLTRTFRAVAIWDAHTDGILGIEEWNGQIITHARDNKLHVWASISSLPTVAETATSSAQAVPKLLYSMDVNALNFCRFSLLLLPSGLALLAVPNLVESEFTDIWSLPSIERIHAAVGKTFAKLNADPLASDGRPTTQGIVMSNHLFHGAQTQHDEKSPRQLRLLSAYEDGSVVLYARTQIDRERSVEGKGWDALWTAKVHVESVMALIVAHDTSFALSVSADHIIGRYLLSDVSQPDTERATIHRTKRAGNSSIALRADDRVCAVGGWDGKIRLYSARTLKPLGSLSYHVESCYALAFAHPHPPVECGDGMEDEDDGYDEGDKETRSRWLVSAGKEGRIAFWVLDSFEKQKGQESKTDKMRV